jgi:23S rRNA (guanine745-N1)-methyltransferase
LRVVESDCMPHRVRCGQEVSPVLSEVVEFLACPTCGREMLVAEKAVRCATGHSFDIARQGYVNLVAPGTHTGTADTADMVAARARFLAAGHMSAVADAVASAVVAAVPPQVAGCVADLGAGTGYYLSRVLDAQPDRVGVALDISKHAMRRAARANDRIGAVVCDAWGRLPLRDGSAAVVLNIFAPRNPEEMARILSPRGALVVVTPDAGHLHELVGPLGLLTVDAEKASGVDARLSGQFTRASTVELRTRVALSRDDVLAAASMGPSAHHVSGTELAARVAAVPDPYKVTLGVDVTVYARRQIS